MRTPPLRKKEIVKSSKQTIDRTTTAKVWKRRYKNVTLDLSWLKPTIFLVTILGLFETVGTTTLTRMVIEVGSRSMIFRYQLPQSEEILIRCTPFTGNIKLCMITNRNEQCSCRHLME